MPANRRNERISRMFEEKEFRDAYAFEHIAVGIPFQIRAMRKGRGWSQSALASRAGKRQSWISAIERDDKASYTITTLAEIASALDVALLVKFVPFSKLLSETEGLSSESLDVVTYAEDIMPWEVEQDLARVDVGLPHQGWSTNAAPEGSEELYTSLKEDHGENRTVASE